ncbi:PH (Pleckstrin Homology) domain-containing protein [Labedella gwakjiensis]|uniref:PH (Pleckstrin Homology) domain-containing protein n=1 Tax=Labedella gwakjiensis TaxID=390269 RepID=A0A2P8GXS7_9MICO|nr:PH domain-containing protein [Labedella gwakjiensis]PSL38767.1 PH (Pleckstrin Homology) domain-containing protein [Labedella gwakjiensis]RUQ86752.1 PH domain-containing protein [Labedella gwakjiensis]
MTFEQHAQAGAAARAAGATEQVVARMHRNARVLFLPAVLFIALAGGVVYLLGVAEETWQLIGGLVTAGLLFLFGVLIPFLFWLTRSYTLTTKRLIVRHGLFTRTRREVLHSRGYAVTLKRGPFQTIAGSGTIIVDSGNDRPLVLADVPGAVLVQSTLHELVERAQATGGGYTTGPNPGGTTRFD